MPGGFLIGELGGRLVQGKIPESGRTAEQGQPVQNGKAGQHAALQPGEPGHMGYAVPSAAQVYPAAYAALDMLFQWPSRTEEAGTPFTTIFAVQEEEEPSQSPLMSR